jgi:hypothetical protein
MDTWILRAHFNDLSNPSIPQERDS